MRSTLLFLILLMPSIAISEQPRSWIVRLDTSLPVHATGYFIGKDGKGNGLLITANHVLDYSPVYVLDPPLPPVKIERIVGRDWDKDVAVALVPWSGPVGYISTTIPSIGDFVQTIGATSLSGTGVVTRLGIGNRGLYISTNTTNGDSGAPIINSRKYIVGMISGGYNPVGESYGPNCSAIQRVLRGIGWKCENGKCVQIMPPGQEWVPVQRPTPPPRMLNPVQVGPAEPPKRVPIKTTPNDPIVTNQPEPSAPVEKNPVPTSATKTNPIVSVAVGKSEGSGFSLPTLILTGVASALGLGIPTWAIMAYRGARTARKIRKWRKEPKAIANEPMKGPIDLPNKGEQFINRTHVVDAPQPKERWRIDSQFINVESDHYQRAHEQARQQIARRYPGAQEILEAELDLTRQFAAGTPA